MSCKRIFSVFSVIALLFVSLSAMAQPEDRDFIRQQIEKQGRCRNVAITKTNGDLMLYGKNGWAANACPQGLTDALDYLNETDEFIDEVQLTEKGKWVIIYGDNGLRYDGIPEDLEDALLECVIDDEVIHSVTFNDAGEWVLITGSFVQSSDDDLTEYILNGQEEFGAVWTACMTDDAMVVVYAKGFQTLGEIPESLKKAMSETDIDIFRLKIAGDSWFFSDGEDEYDYEM